MWFDSGAMPYAQLHYPFENYNYFKENFPADFIAEGVDQTRGWFFTLHAIATIIFDSVAFKNVISNGLVLDKEGNKMSKRLGHAINHLKQSSYMVLMLQDDMISNAQPWENLKFNASGIEEVKENFLERYLIHIASFLYMQILINLSLQAAISTLKSLIN